MFDALYLEKPESGFSARRRQLSDDELVAATPDADVTVRIDYSTVNYKDALALTNRSPVVRRWPMVPGIDGAGVVESSTHPGFAAGDAVVLNGWGVGEAHWGCLAQRARLKGDWLIAMPKGLDARRAMAIGTAGYTAML
ncbi:MAG TPA: alcohol dehydrogenase catalytic domain-containing protein, partial [Burkholderiaceae bacterium]|nr:alcohol dehydrogenase catalytic domain-containing protein [Burkholderiaceae bacterium]